MGQWADFGKSHCPYDQDCVCAPIRRPGVLGRVFSAPQSQRSALSSLPCRVAGLVPEEQFQEAVRRLGLAEVRGEGAVDSQATPSL